MRQHGAAPEDTRAMDNMIEVYEPTNSLVMVYVNHNGEISASMTPQTGPTPEECYRILQETTYPTAHHAFLPQATLDKFAQLPSSGIRVRKKASSIQSK